MSIAITTTNKPQVALFVSKQHDNTSGSEGARCEWWQVLRTFHPPYRGHMRELRRSREAAAASGSAAPGQVLQSAGCR
jgi:hypothetical protein